MQEERNQRFKRLATYRTNEILNKLRLLGNLSNKANYDYSEDEINKIFSAIDSQTKLIKAKFVSISKKRKDFTL